MNIRPAVIEEVEDLVGLALSFLNTTHYYEVLAQDASADSLGALIMTLFGMGENACLLVAEDRGGTIVGGIGLIAVPHPFTGREYADELVWWVEPGHRNQMAGPKLLQAAEQWARARGLNLIKMVAPVVSDVGRYYERSGYQAIETAFVKVL